MIMVRENKLFTDKYIEELLDLDDVGGLALESSAELVDGGLVFDNNSESNALTHFLVDHNSPEQILEFIDSLSEYSKSKGYIIDELLLFNDTSILHGTRFNTFNSFAIAIMSYSLQWMFEPLNSLKKIISNQLLVLFNYAPDLSEKTAALSDFYINQLRGSSLYKLIYYFLSNNIDSCLQFSINNDSLMLPKKPTWGSIEFYSEKRLSAYIHNIKKVEHFLSQYYKVLHLTYRVHFYLRNHQDEATNTTPSDRIIVKDWKSFFEVIYPILEILESSGLIENITGSPKYMSRLFYIEGEVKSYSNFSSNKNISISNKRKKEIREVTRMLQKNEGEALKYDLGTLLNIIRDNEDASNALNNTEFVLNLKNIIKIFSENIENVIENHIMKMRKIENK